MNKFGFVLASAILAAVVTSVVPAQSIEEVFGEDYEKKTPFGGLNKEEYLKLQSAYFDKADLNDDGILTYSEKARLTVMAQNRMPSEARMDIVNSMRTARGEPPLTLSEGTVKEQPRFDVFIIRPENLKTINPFSAAEFALADPAG